MPDRVEFVIGAEISALTDVLDRIGNLLREHGICGDLISDIELAVDEAVTNSILHGYGEKETGTISLFIQVHPDRVELEIEDQGVPFDPTTFEPVVNDGDIADRVPGGLGIVLIRNVMDTITYRRERERNVLHLEKRIAP
jgi:serine/threonine-protein kinase RsbW